MHLIWMSGAERLGERRKRSSAEGGDLGPAALEAGDAPQALLLASQMLLLAAIAASLPTGATRREGLKETPRQGSQSARVPATTAPAWALHPSAGQTPRLSLLRVVRADPDMVHFRLILPLEPAHLNREAGMKKPRSVAGLWHLNSDALA